MKKTFSTLGHWPMLLICWGLLFCFTNIGAQNLHMIVICETNDNNIGAPADYTHMQNFAAKVAQQASLNLKPHFLEKQNLSENQIATKVNNLNVGTDDVVWFYYSGHGFNLENSDYSAFRIGDTRYSMDWVFEKLKAKNPRLLLVMYDACNWYGDTRSHQIIASRTNDQFKFAKLFRKAKGTIKVASNKAGYQQYSYGSPGIGGVFTNAFFNAMGEAVDSWETPNVSWSKVMNRTSELTQQYARSMNKEQVPDMDINIREGNLQTGYTPESPGGKDPGGQK